MTAEEEKTIEGIIIDVDYGFGMKYADPNNMYLKIEIQMFDGFLCTQLFGIDKIGKLLLQFKGDYRDDTSIKNLVHQKLYLLDDRVNSVPSAIAKLPPSQYPQYSWIENDNWN